MPRVYKMHPGHFLFVFNKLYVSKWFLLVVKAG